MLIKTYPQAANLFEKIFYNYNLKLNENRRRT